MGHARQAKLKRRFKRLTALADVGMLRLHPGVSPSTIAHVSHHTSGILTLVFNKLCHKTIGHSDQTDRVYLFDRPSDIARSGRG